MPENDRAPYIQHLRVAIPSPKHRIKTRVTPRWRKHTRGLGSQKSIHNRSSGFAPPSLYLTTAKVYQMVKRSFFAKKLLLVTALAEITACQHFWFVGWGQDRQYPICIDGGLKQPIYAWDLCVYLCVKGCELWYGKTGGVLFFCTSFPYFPNQPAAIEQKQMLQPFAYKDGITKCNAMRKTSDALVNNDHILTMQVKENKMIWLQCWKTTAVPQNNEVVTIKSKAINYCATVHHADLCASSRKLTHCYKTRCLHQALSLFSLFFNQSPFSFTFFQVWIPHIHHYPFFLFHCWSIPPPTSQSFHFYQHKHHHNAFLVESFDIFILFLLFGHSCAWHFERQTNNNDYYDHHHYYSSQRQWSRYDPWYHWRILRNDCRRGVEHTHREPACAVDSFICWSSYAFASITSYAIVR